AEMGAAAGRRPASRPELDAPPRDPAPADPLARTGVESLPAHAAASARESLPALRGHDHAPAPDRGRGQPRRSSLGGLRVPLQTRRREAPPRVRRPASATSRLADVVRRPERFPKRALVSVLLQAAARGRAAGHGTPGAESVSESAAPLPSRRGLRL